VSALSQCGRRYRDFDEAYRAAELRASKGAAKLRVVSCEFGDHWHLLPARTVIMGRIRRPRPDPFPPPVAALIDNRDGHACQGCGSSERLERHHRRAKGSGGSKARAHTQCPCNGLLLCRRCHQWAHLNPGQARLVGVIVPQAADRPGEIGVLRRSGIGWPTCEGRWIQRPEETED
jgi:hypothetical protein